MIILSIFITFALQNVCAMDLVDVLLSNGGKTFVSLAEKAGLLGKLQTENLTIFAPNDNAFGRLPSFLLEILRQDNDTLFTMMSYHIIEDEVTSADMTSDMKLMTFSGLPVRINMYNNNKLILVEGTKLKLPDRRASNGVVHLVDRIMRPPHGTALKILENEVDNSIFYNLIKRTSLKNLLNDKNANLTVFVPTNLAFSDPLSKLYVDGIVNNTKLLTDVLQYHILPQTVYQSAITDGTHVPTLLNTTDKLEFRNFDLGLHADNSLITLSDTSASNGVIHQIKNVLIPESLLVDAGLTSNLVDVSKLRISTKDISTTSLGKSGTRLPVSLNTRMDQFTYPPNVLIDLSAGIDTNGQHGNSVSQPDMTTRTPITDMTTQARAIKNFRVGSIVVDTENRTSGLKRTNTDSRVTIPTTNISGISERPSSSPTFNSTNLANDSNTYTASNITMATTNFNGTSERPLSSPTSNSTGPANDSNTYTDSNITIPTTNFSGTSERPLSSPTFISTGPANDSNTTYLASNVTTATKNSSETLEMSSIRPKTNGKAIR